MTSPKVPVAVVTMRAGSPETILEIALSRAGFWRSLETKAASNGGALASVRIAIKPDLDIFEPAAPTGTDPRLVEHLIALLRARGYDAVVVCDGRNQPDGWLHNRGPLCVPDLAGYHFEAPAGTPYEVASAADTADAVPLNAYDDGQALRVCSAWMQADFRITLGRNKTDDRHAYALCVHNLLGLIAPHASAARWTPEERCVHLMRRAAPDFAILDAIVSSHGDCGSRRLRALRTNAIIASPSAVLVDWIAALKMGVDPHDSPVNAAVLNTLGLPEPWVLLGSAAPWPKWQNPSRVLLHSVRQRGEWEAMDLLARAVLQPVDRERFPFRSLVLDQLNATVTSRLYAISDQRLERAVEGLVHQLLALAARAHRAYGSSAKKESVLRSNAPVLSDVARLGSDAFDVTEHVVQRAERALVGAVPDARGFRFQSVGGHMHFAGARPLPYRYEEFVERVDITRSIQYMNDYVGGQTLAVSRDRQGRITRQIERNVYLPQPNWVSVFGGQPIDVEKLERVRYGASRQVIWWRTIQSINGTAESDDGSVAFVRNGIGEVDVRLFARQRFNQPRAVAAAGIERFRGIYGQLVADAYAHFFDGTLANLKSAYEGVPFRIGVEAPPPDARDLVSSQGLFALLGAAAALLAKIMGPTWPIPADGKGTTAFGGAAIFPYEVDELGFRHFAGEVGTRFAVAMSDASREAAVETDDLSARLFVAELGQALARDVRTMFAGTEHVQ